MSPQRAEAWGRPGGAEAFREDLSPALLREWEALVYAAGGSFFQSPQWVQAWRRSYASRVKVFLLTVRTPDGTLCGLLPVAELSRPLHRLLPIPLHYMGIAGAGRGAADHLGPVATSTEVATALVCAAVRLRPGCSTMLESMGPIDPPTLSDGLAKRTACPAAILEAVDRVEELWSKKLRENLRRHRRQAEKAGLELRWYRPGRTCREVLGEIGALHVARHRSLGRSGLFDKQRHELLAALSEARFRDQDGQWVATMIDESGRIRAGLVGFQYACAFYEYKTGWDPGLRKLAPGKILKTASMKRAMEEGLEVYDFLRGREKYKYRLGGEDRWDTTLLVPSGFTGRLLRLRERFDVNERGGV